MLGEAAAAGAAPSDASIPLVEEGVRPRLREVHAEGHGRPVGGQDGPSRSSSRLEHVRVVPRQPNLVNNNVKEVVGVWGHQLPPRGRLPQEN